MKPAALALSLAALLGGGAAAQELAQDPLSRMIWNMFKMRQGKTLCMAEETPLAVVRSHVVNQLRMMGEYHDPAPQAVAQALWTLYPCPFSPFRAELRPATQADIEGAWIFPAASQRLRLDLAAGPQSPPVACDALGYYYGGNLKQAVVREPAACPFETADDFETATSQPQPAKWSLIRDGRIAVSRPDLPEHVEEWDVFAVFSPFEVDGVRFQAGDLVAYDRRSRNNHVNAATRFRHLQRLP